jgi:homoserine O-acetyltransferase
VARAVVLAVGAAASAEQIALCSLQIRAIRADPAFAGGDYYGRPDWPLRGLAIARGIGQVSYRTADELAARFGRRPQGAEHPRKGGRYEVESYLEHHGETLGARFDPNTYVVLSEAMNHHDVGVGRGGLGAALARVDADVTVAGITSDRLYPLSQQHELAGLLPGRPPVQVVESVHGHDGFLIETEAVGAVIAGALARR